MAELLIPGVEEPLLACLQQRAQIRGRTKEEEAKAILAAALRPDPADVWADVTAFRERLAATGRNFGDSTELVREDRER